MNENTYGKYERILRKFQIEICIMTTSHAVNFYLYTDGR